MGKSKEQKLETFNAFSRMNYLFQASVLASKILPNSALGRYYGRLMSEVSKKVVEKIHPDVKRSLCLCCSHPLFTNANNCAAVRVKSHTKRKNKKKLKKVIEKLNLNEIEDKKQYKIRNSNKRDYPTNQAYRKNLKPNKLVWKCKKCGYSRCFQQRPAHSLHINRNDE